ncbi:hypothetical protein BYT27DRAFT_7079078, partial [Phlegmacium glaucopus]
RLSPVNIISYVWGAYDNMFSNASTVKVELDKWRQLISCKILCAAIPKSLVILDGKYLFYLVGPGLISTAVLHPLANHTFKSLSFFATHFGPLTDDCAYHPNIRTMHMSNLVDDEKQEVHFLDFFTSSFMELQNRRTRVENLAGAPLDVVKCADLISKDFAKQFNLFKEKPLIKQEQSGSSKMPPVAQADFAYISKLGVGEVKLPENTLRRKETLVRLKDVARCCLERP